ncbi:peptidase [Sinomonas flava]|uniref:peptidase n=1 Tax=Sinomonas flava TaxID=496857 RepID=UPI0039A65E1D
MKKKIGAALALSGALVLAGAVPAVAGQYPAPQPGAVVSISTVTPGQPFTITVTNFTPNERVLISFTIVAGPQAAGGGGRGGAGLSVPGVLAAAPAPVEVVANANGVASATIVLNEPGTYVLTGTGATSGHSASTRVVVVGSAEVAQVSDQGQTGGQALAQTGADPALIGWSIAGVGAVAAGAAVTIVARRRSATRQ